ncbi:MAG: hypothetical protein ACKVOG_03235 [Rhodoglobus sp.]
MSDALLKIDVETTGLIAALDSLGAFVFTYTKAAARVTADRIVASARARVRRRTGRTAAGITAQESYDKKGYVVLPFNDAFERALIESGNDQQPENLPIWLEFGTKKMTAKPYFFAAAKVEEQAHDRRMRAAIQDAIDAKGLGD